MRVVNENTFEIVKNKIIIKKQLHPTKFMWNPKQWKFKVSWHPQNKGGRLRRLHLIIRIPFFHLIRNNGFTSFGNHVAFIIFN